MERKMIRTEEIEYETDRKTAEKLKKHLMKTLLKDKKSDSFQFSYTYRPFRKRADFLIGGREKLVLKCIKVFDRLVLKTEKAKEKREAEQRKLIPMKKGTSYTMKSLKDRNKRRRV